MAKSIKKLLSLVIAVVMVLSLIPAVSAAETETAEQTQTANQTNVTRGVALGASKTYEADLWIEVDTAEELKAALKNGGGASASANADIVSGVRLTADVTYTAAVAGKSSGTHLYFGYYKDATDTEPSKSRAQTVVLDLNGHTLTAAEDLKGSRLFGAYGGSTVTITNGTIIQNGAYTGYAPAMFYNGGVDFTIDGVEWIMRDESERTTYGGFFNLSSSSQSLTVINSTLTKEGGTVYRGGLVNTSGAATITLKNSEFNGGHAVGKGTDYFARGGQFYVADKANMTAENCAFIGGQVSGDTDYVQGGNICKYGDEGTVTLTGCTVSGGSAKQGGNIAMVASGRVILEDTTVTGGTSTAEGGSIFLNTGSLTLNGDTFITGGQAYNKGGNIYVTAGTVNINDNTIVEKGVIANEGNVLTYGGNICVDGTTEEKATTLNMNGGIIRDGNVSSSSTASSTYIGGGNIAGFYGVTINLNGGQILNGKAKNNDTTNGLAMGANIYVGSSSVLNIYDGVTVSGGFADSAKNNQNRGGNIGYTGSTVNVYGGLIENGKADRAGNLFAPSTSAKLNIYGGVIKDGNATNSYGGNMSCNGAVKIYGGLISGGKASTTYGESIYMADNTNAVLHVYGGIIDSTVNNAVYKGSSSKATIQLHSVVLGDEPNTAYIAECSSMSEVDGMFHVVHNDVEGATTIVDATCSAAGSKTIDCATCKQAYTYEIPALGHDYVGTQTKAPTCTADGEMTYVCKNDANHTYTEAIPASGTHTPGTPVIENEVANSCTADGSYDTVVYCTVCNAQISRETTTVSATGHTAGEPVIENEVANSCTADGSYDTVVYCTVCNAQISRETTTVSATGHTEETIPGKDATCADTGLTEGKKCTVCGAVTVAQNEIPALGHKYEDVKTEATFENDAFTTYTCSVCGDSYVETEEGTKLTAVATADGVPFETLQEALTAGGEVVLLQDVTATEKLTVATAATLDLGGNVLTLADVAGNYALIVKGELTIAGNGTIVAPGGYGIGVTGKLTVNGGNFFGDQINDYIIGNWGEVTINDGFFWGIYNVLNTFAEGSGTAVITGGQFMTDETDYTGDYESTAILGINTTVTGGQFDQLESEYVADNYAYITTGEVVALKEVIADDIVTLESDVTMTEKLTVSGTTILDLNGHTLTLADLGYNYGLVVTGNLKIVGNGTIVAPGGFGIGVNASGYLTIENGTFVAGTYNDYIVGNFGVTVINGGTFQGVYNCVNNFAGVTMIYGGTYSTAAFDWSGEYESADLFADAGLTVYGGTYSKPVAPEFCAENLCPKQNADGTYTVTEKAGFAKAPESVTAEAGETVTFTVETIGEIAAYRWEYSQNGTTWYNTKMEGNTTATLTVPVLLSRDGYQYRCVISDIYGNGATSAPATLTVNQPAGLVQIVNQPDGIEAVAGLDAIFTVEATGDGLEYQWQYTKNGTNWYYTGMTGAKTAQLTVTATAARNGYQYRCVITDAYGTQVISEAAMLAVTEKNITTSGPEDQVAVGGKAVFTVAVEGEGLTYEWQYQRADGTKWFYTTMEGFATNTLTVNATASRNGYKYRCIITDAYGNETISEEAVLTVE